MNRLPALPFRQSTSDASSSSSSKLSLSVAPLVLLYACLTTPCASGGDVLAHWRLDEGQGTVAKDFGPKGLDFTLTNCRWVEGKDGRALHFDRQGSFGLCYTTAAKMIELTKGSYALSLWIKPDRDCKRNELYEILNCHGSERGPGYRLFYYASGIWFRSGTGKKKEISQVRTASTRAPVVKGEWNMVHVVIDEETGGKVYVNGELAAENADLKVCPPKRSKRRVVLGCYTDTRKASRLGFKGSIDEVKIVGRAKSAVEILKEAKEIDF